MLTFVPYGCPNAEVHSVIFGGNFRPGLLDARLASQDSFGAVNAFSAVGVSILFLEVMVEKAIEC